MCLSLLLDAQQYVQKMHSWSLTFAVNCVKAKIVRQLSRSHFNFSKKRTIQIRYGFTRFRRKTRGSNSATRTDIRISHPDKTQDPKRPEQAFCNIKSVVWLHNFFLSKDSKNHANTPLWLATLKRIESNHAKNYGKYWSVFAKEVDSPHLISCKVSLKSSETAVSTTVYDAFVYRKPIVCTKTKTLLYAQNKSFVWLPLTGLLVASEP